MGEVFAGRYELLDLIGEGGMGSVWRVWDAREHRIVAAKVLRQSDAVSLLRFVREQAMRVQHPHVLTPIGWAGEDDRVLFTMPVVDGGSIGTLVGDHGPLPVPMAAELLRQLLDAVGAVHAAGILHRDVKPANVLLMATGSGRPHTYLTDFGIAIEMDGPRFTQTGEFTGTPGYLAPEARLGAEPDPTADLYAAGQVAVAMLTGERPTTPPRRPEGVPDSLWSLVVDLTQLDPARRPQTAAEASARLASLGLDWVDGAAGEVEVLRQVPEPAEGTTQLTAVPKAATSLPDQTRVAGPHPPDPSTVDRPEDDEPTRVRVPVGDSSPAVAAARPGLRPPWLAGALLILVALVAGVLVWSPWSTSTAGPKGRTTPGTTSSSSRPSTEATTGATATGTRPTTAAPTTATQGTVRVGTVVTSVGQPCEFSDVGLSETTEGGQSVVCQHRTDGSYAWDPPPG